MKKYFLIPILIIFLGFIVAALLPSRGTICTLTGCPCEGVEGERPCNTCSFSKPIFTTGLLNVVQSCSAQEIVFCENNKAVDRRIDFDNKECEYDWYVLTFNLRNFGRRFEDPTQVMIYE
jgi:hypothetical protein